jgi:hypothetical protein
MCWMYVYAYISAFYYLLQLKSHELRLNTESQDKFDWLLKLKEKAEGCGLDPVGLG